VTSADEKAWIATTVAEIRSRFNIPADPARRGPVPLRGFLEEHNLLHVTLPELTRGAVAAYFRQEYAPFDEPGLNENADEVLAGCLLTTATDGYVFVGQCEPDRSSEGERKNKFTVQSRQRFTAAHELGHFVLHRDRMNRFIADTNETILEEGDPEKAKDMERQANRFAAELLMPREVCFARAEEFTKAYGLDRLPRQSFAYHLAAELLVSTDALRNRMKELKIGGDPEAGDE
jgi:hypothetical protein